MPKSTRRPLAARCMCPRCAPTWWADADVHGVKYCTVDREWAAYASGQFIGAYDYQAQAAEALAVYRLDQAAAEADMSHDVQQATTDGDVVAALTCSDCGKINSPDCLTCAIDSTPHDWKQIDRDIADAATHAANAALSEYPTFTYSRAHRGFIYVGRDEVYQTQTEAALARDGK